MANPIEINDEYITLGQFLKFADIVPSGGMVKVFLQEYSVYVNGELETRRGKKLRPGDEIEISEFGSFQIKQASEESH